MISPDEQTWQRLATFYHYLTHHIVPGPNSSSYFFPLVLLPVALLIPPSILSHRQLGLLFLPIIYACQIHAWLTSSMDVISINLTLWSFVLLVWRDPRRTHRRVYVLQERIDGKKREECVEEAYPADSSKRIPWVLTLLVSLRLTGWKIGEPSHDQTQPPPGKSRLTFLKGALRTVIKSYIILDASCFYAQTDPYFSASNMSIDEPYPPPTSAMPAFLVLLRLLPPRLLRSSVLAGQIYAMVPGLFFLPTLPAVGLNALGFWPNEWSPQTWPEFFGKFSAVGERGLRGLWGSWWHGMNRQITATHGGAVADVLRIPSKSSARYMVLVTSAFFFSGVIHAGLIPPEPESKSLSAHMMRLHVAGFFWAQIPAFGVELATSELVDHFAPNATRRSLVRVLVMVWVAGWLCLTLPLLTVPFREIGYWHYYAVPFSIMRGVAGQGWITWR